MRFRSGLVWGALLSLWTPPVLAQDTEVVLRHLSLRLGVDVEDGTIAGTAGLTVENLGREPLARVHLLLGRLLMVSDVEVTDGALRGWSQDVVVFEDWPEYQVNQLDLDLAQPLGPGQAITFDIAYSGVLVGYTETGMLYVQDRVSPEFTVLRSDALAFPTLGRASLAQRRARRREDFTFDATISVSDPTLTVAAASPPERSPGPDGSAAWRFESREPVPFLLIAIAPYAILRGDAATIYHFEEDRPGATRLMQAVQRARDRYGSWFGPLSTTRPVTIMEIPAMWGSQASLTGGIIQTADAFRDGGAIPQLYHEIAHLWHPRELERPADRWNEGLATFLQWRLEAESNPSVDLWTEMKAIAERVLGADERSPLSVPMTEFGDANLTGYSYRVGALFFFALYHRLGPDTFDRCLGSYFRTFRSTGSDNEDFLSSLRDCDQASDAVIATWATSLDWLHRLRTGESLDSLLERPRRARPNPSGRSRLPS